MLDEWERQLWFAAGVGVLLLQGFIMVIFLKAVDLLRGLQVQFFATSSELLGHVQAAATAMRDPATHDNLHALRDDPATTRRRGRASSPASRH